MIEIKDSNFGNQVKKKLIDLGIKQTDIIEKLDITGGYLSMILANKKESFDMRKKIVDLLEDIEKKTI